MDSTNTDEADRRDGSALERGVMHHLHGAQMVSLSEQERLLFIRWLDEQAMSNRALAEQTDKLPGKGPWTLVSERHRSEASAMELIARRLRNTETMDVGGR